MMEAACGQTRRSRWRGRREVKSGASVPRLIRGCFGSLLGLASGVKLTVWLIKWARQHFPLHLGISLRFDSLLFLPSVVATSLCFFFFSFFLTLSIISLQAVSNHTLVNILSIFKIHIWPFKHKGNNSVYLKVKKQQHIFVIEVITRQTFYLKRLECIALPILCYLNQLHFNVGFCANTWFYTTDERIKSRI